MNLERLAFAILAFGLLVNSVADVFQNNTLDSLTQTVELHNEFFVQVLCALRQTDSCP